MSFISWYLQSYSITSLVYALHYFGALELTVGADFFSGFYRSYRLRRSQHSGNTLSILPRTLDSPSKLVSNQSFDSCSDLTSLAHSRSNVKIYVQRAVSTKLSKLQLGRICR